MNGDLALGRSIRQAIERGNYLRRATARLDDIGAYKEWLHFCVSAPELDLFVNFSFGDDTRPSAPERAEVARLVCAVRDDEWDGDVEHFDADDVSVRAGRLGLRFGDNVVHYSGGAYRVVISLRRRPITVDITLRPVTVASQINNIALGDAPLHWFVLPRLLASGEVRVGDRRFELENLPGYHDHNWGSFRWGQNFSWIWGYGHGRSLRSPWGVAFDRLSDRARTTDYLRGILLWKGARQHRVFGGTDITVRTEGVARPTRVFKLPRVMALLRPGLATEVPRTLVGRAEGRGDVLEFEFTSEHICQVITPNDDDLGVTIINEVSGPLTLSGVVRGERVELDGRAMFEFLGD